jgi:hypothetical protein
MGKRSFKRLIEGAPDRKKREVIELTTGERKQAVRKIIEKLHEHQLNTSFDAVVQLYKLFKRYISEGERIEVNILFPEINRRIKGILAISQREEGYIKLVEA